MLNFCIRLPDFCRSRHLSLGHRAGHKGIFIAIKYLYSEKEKVHKSTVRNFRIWKLQKIKIL